MADAKSEARKAASKVGTVVSGGKATVPSKPQPASSSQGNKSEIQKQLEREKINAESARKNPKQYEGLSDAAKEELRRQGYVPPPPPPKKSEGFDESEAKKQAEIHGITKGGQFADAPRKVGLKDKSLSQQEFENLSPQLQKEYNIQAEESQRKEAEYKKQQAKEKKAAHEYPTTKVGSAIVPTSLLPPKLGQITNAPDTEQMQKNYDKAFATQYESEKGLTLEGEKLDPSNIFQGTEEEYQAYVLEYEKQKKTYEEDLIKQASGIVSEGKAKGATKIQIYNLEDQPIGALAVSGAEEPLKYLLRTGEFKYGFTVPKTAEEKAEQEKVKEKRKQFKGFIKSEQKLGASGFEIYDKSGKLVAVTSADHTVYDIMKAQKEHGEVSIKTKFSQETILESYTKGSLGEPIEFTRGLADTLQAIGVELGTGGSGTTEPPQAIKEIKEKYIPSTAIDPILSGRPTEKPVLYNIGSIIAFGGILSLGARVGRVKATPTWVGIDVAKTLKVIQPKTLTPYFKPTNMFREQLPKDIFKFDTAKTPTGSAAPERPMKPMFESGEDAIAKAKKSQEVLLEPIKSKVEKPAEPLEPKFTQIFETGGRPPIKREPTFEVFGTKPPIEEPLPRAEMVELTKVLPQHEVFSARGKLLGIVGEAGPPQGALAKITQTKTTVVREEPFYKPEISEFKTRLGKKGTPEEKGKIDTDRMLGIERPSQGLAESAFRSFIERTKPTTKEVQEVKGYKPDISDFYSQLSRTKLPKKGGKINTTRLLDIETPQIGEPKSFTETLKKLNVKLPEKTKLTKESEKAFRGFFRRFEEPKPSGKEIRTGSGQVLVQKTKTEQVTKLATKSIVRKKERRLATQPLVTTQYQEEETYLSKQRPRPAARTVLVTRTKLRESERLSTNITQGLGIKTERKTEEKMAPKLITEMIITPEQKQKERLTAKLTPRQVQDMPTPLRPKIKQPLAQPQKQKQPQKLLQKEPPKPPPKRLVFAFPPLPSGKKEKEPKESETGLRADFIGNVRVSDIQGIYSRSEVTYGQKKINRLLREDRPRGKKFVRGSSRSYLKKTRTNILTRPKKTKRLRL